MVSLPGLLREHDTDLDTDARITDQGARSVIRASVSKSVSCSLGKSLGVYTDTLPIATQICGYHAFAEAGRLRQLGDEVGARPWYQEAVRRLDAELEDSRSSCREHFEEQNIRGMLTRASEYISASPRP